MTLIKQPEAERRCTRSKRSAEIVARGAEITACGAEVAACGVEVATRGVEITAGGCGSAYNCMRDSHDAYKTAGG
ncbi:MAG: hypothetical protein LBD24_08670 [Spirochaetaceae bacterium]|nr:hypothetical protein [Spirochaetaceae bacterium]